MVLEKYNWNNGTQDSPIILTNDQIKKFILIGQKEGLECNVSGWVTTNSRKMQKFLHVALEEQFPNLNVICDEDLPDVFALLLSTVNLTEGNNYPITITGTSGITHNHLLWDIQFNNITIEPGSDISEQNIRDRIHVTDGKIVVDDPQENATWVAEITVTAYPKYYQGQALNTIPEVSRPSLDLNVRAIGITGINASAPAEVPIGGAVDIQVTPLPENSTKLKGAKVTYSSLTDSTVFVNHNVINTIASGVGTVRIVLDACNNAVNLHTDVSFNIYDLRPTSFILDQRGNLSDPQSMVSQNYVKDNEGNITVISNNGVDGDPSTNTLTWLRRNTHAYVGKYDPVTDKIRLKQLDDTNRKLFADGTSSVGYIDSESGNYDVWLKFPCDIYIKSEPWTPAGQTTPNPDYPLITVAREIPSGENPNDWEKWDGNWMIGVYPASKIGNINKLYSLSGRIPVNNISQITCRQYARNRGNSIRIVTYAMNRLIAILYYGYYGNTHCQNQCGYGTLNTTDDGCYPKKTGLCDNLCMTDTTDVTGNGAQNPSETQIKQGYGADIKNVNFWGIEKCWGDIFEWIDDMQVYQIFTSAAIENTTASPNTTLVSWLNTNNQNSVVITIDGIDTTFTKASGQTWADVFTQAMSDYGWAWGDKVVAIFDRNDNVQRWIKSSLGNSGGTISKMMFGDHCDTFAKAITYNNDQYLCDYGGLGSAGNVARRSHISVAPAGGVGCLYMNGSAAAMHPDVGSRLLFEGTSGNVHIINDKTETL